jgi:hypothetical protein
LLLEYPSKLLNTTLQCVFASIQSFVIARVLEGLLAVEARRRHHPSLGALHGEPYSSDFLGVSSPPGVDDNDHLTIIYSFPQGIVVAAISYYLQIWVSILLYLK